MNHNKYIQDVVDTIEDLKGKEIEEKIEKIARQIVETYSKKGLLIICGNGGSAADAQHFAAEHIGAYLDRNRKPFPAISLTSNTSNLTAIANDFGYEEVFSRQLEAFDKIDYVLIGISTSGNSENVNRAINHAKKTGKFTVGLSGKQGGRLKELSNICITVPRTDSTPIIQTAHNIIYHRICELVETFYK